MQPHSKKQSLQGMANHRRMTVYRTETRARTAFGAVADTQIREAGKQKRNLDAVKLLAYSAGCWLWGPNKEGQLCVTDSEQRTANDLDLREQTTTFTFTTLAAESRRATVVLPHLHQGPCKRTDAQGHKESKK